MLTEEKCGKEQGAEGREVIGHLGREGKGKGHRAKGEELRAGRRKSLAIGHWV